MGLQRKITPVSLLFTSLSCMIGSGWLFGAYYTAQVAGPASVISWLIGGGLILILALVFSELGTMLPLAGGLARYTHFTHGETVSFCMTWLAWLSCVAVAPTEVQAILQYASATFPWLTHQVDNVVVLTTQGLSIAAVLLFLFAWINTRGLGLLIRCNNLITLWKLMIPLGTALWLASHHFSVSVFHDTAWMPYGWHGVLAALPAAVIFSYLGFREATSLAGEAKNPKYAIPLAVLGSVVICMLLYAAIQLVFLGALSPEMYQSGWHHLHFVGDAGPFAGLAMAVGLTGLSWIVYADAVISPTGTGLIYTATTARLNYAMGLQQQHAKKLIQLNKHHVPSLSIWLNFIVGLFLFMPLPTWQALIKFQAIAIVLAYGVGPISLLSLRAQAPDISRPFQLFLPYVMSFFAFYVCNLLAYWSGWETLWSVMSAFGLGVVVFLVSHLLSDRTQAIQWRHSLWIIPHFTGLLIISYWGGFGGGLNKIGFGYDFLCIALLTLFSLVLALKSRLPVAQCQARLQAVQDS